MGSLLEPVLSRHWTNVEEVAEDTFEGTCVSQEPDGRVYGGHVLAQSLAAAYHTAPEGFVVNSLHCYFVRGGREDVTITYKVKTVRNGRNFAVRFVEAMQQEKVIHIAEVSFQKNAAFPVISLSPVFPSVPAPESLEPVVSETMDRMTPQLDVRPCDWEVHRKEKTATKRCVWLKYRVPVGSEDFKLSHSTLAFMSDMHIAGTGTLFLPKGTKINLLTTMDHSLWLHRDRFDVNDWILYEQECVGHAKSRSIIHGRLWSKDGRLLMSTSQEALVYTDIGETTEHRSKM